MNRAGHRRLAVAAVLLCLCACGYKDDLQLPPPGEPEEQVVRTAPGGHPGARPAGRVGMPPARCPVAA